MTKSNASPRSGRTRKSSRVEKLGRSALTGQYVLKPATRGSKSVSTKVAAVTRSVVTTPKNER